MLSFFFLSFVFIGVPRGIWRFPGLGSNQSCCCQPMPEPEQRGIWAASVTYTTAHGNAGSLIHWARPGIEPASSSWMLVRFVNHWATTGTPRTSILTRHPAPWFILPLKWRKPFEDIVSTLETHKVCQREGPGPLPTQIERLDPFFKDTDSQMAEGLWAHIWQTEEFACPLEKGVSSCRLSFKCLDSGL